MITQGREDVALYTGNDDNILLDLVTPFRFAGRTRHLVGGLLGQWGIWTSVAVQHLSRAREMRRQAELPQDWLTLNAEVTDANAAVFDARNQFAGCIPGINEVLRLQGLLPSNRCLDPSEVLSPGQASEIDRVRRAYPHLCDDIFVSENLDNWLR